MTQRIIDLESYRSERIEAALGPARFTGAHLSDDGARVVLDVGSGELLPGQAELLGARLMDLARIAKGASL